MNAAALPLALAVIAGIFIAIQAPTNAILGKASGSPVVAAFISFVVGMVALGRDGRDQRRPSVRA